LLNEFAAALFQTRRDSLKFDMHISLMRALVIFAAAFFAGLINSIAGGGTLLTFPALLWVGLDPRMANATSTVALFPGLLGGIWGYRHELKGNARLLIRLGVTSLIGGTVGGLLLVLTPSPIFNKLVPFLILFATLMFMLQETITRRFKLSSTQTPLDELHARWWLGAIVFQFFSAIYGGYFGAGNGIVMLTVLGLLGVKDIHRANAAKTVFGAILNSMAVVAFSVSGLVEWRDAALMAIAAIIGGYGATHLAFRLGKIFVRRAIVVIGLIIGLVMLWRVY
jgi:uncharacterized membrane protein YfcA